MYIKFKDGPTVISNEIAPDIVADFDAQGGIVGFDIDHASQHIDLMPLDVDGFIKNMALIAKSQ